MRINFLTYLFFAFSVQLSSANVVISYGMSTHQNKRPYQEDRFMHAAIEHGRFFGMYDGHGGSNVSSYLQNHLDKDFTTSFMKMDNLFDEVNVEQAFDDAFLSCERYVLKNYTDGSTALAVYIDKNNVLHCAWTGDTRLVLESNETVGFETKDHKPNDPQELKRIKSQGGSIEKYGVWRVGGLAVSRAIGDAEIKKEYPGQVSAIPECANVQLNAHNHFAIMASDGLWDAVSSESAVKIVTEKLANGDTLEAIAHYLENRAIARGSGDNITVCVIQFNWQPLHPLAEQTTTSILYSVMVQFFDWLRGKK